MSVVQVLTTERPRLVRIAYRMLGSWTDAEDVVGDVAVESIRGEHDPDNPAGWLTTITVRRSLDLLRRRKRERQEYVGTWLPEPEMSDPEASPSLALDRQAELSIGFLRLAESLTAVQRAVIILRSLGYPHEQIATVLEITAVASRQHEYRARRRLGTATAELAHGTDHDQQRVDRQLLQSFLAAAREGDTAKLIDLLHTDVVYYSDGGGRAKAARNPIIGPEKIARFVIGISLRNPVAELHPIKINSRPGMLIELAGDRHLVTADVVDGLIRAVYDVSNPDKISSGPDQISSNPDRVRPAPADSVRTEY